MTTRTRLTLGLVLPIGVLVGIGFLVPAWRWRALGLVRGEAFYRR